QSDAHDRQQSGAEGNATRKRDRLPAAGRAKDLPHLRQRYVAQVIEQYSEADEKAEIADAIDDERFDRRVARGFFLIPESDQQIRAQADQLPENKELKRRSAQD